MNVGCKDGRLLRDLIMEFHIFAIAALAVVYYPHAVFPAVTNTGSVINDLADEGIDLKGAADFVADTKDNAFQAANAVVQDVENFAQDFVQVNNLPNNQNGDSIPLDWIPIVCGGGPRR